MPKLPLGKTILFKKWIVGDSNFSVENEKLFCKLCIKQFDFKRKCEYEQHKSSSMHQAKLNTNKGQMKQQLLSQALVTSEYSDFTKDLVMAFIKEGVPLEKLNEGPIRQTLEKYCPAKLPSISSLRRLVPELHEKSLETIRKEIGDARIWLSIDEATDSLGRNIANVIVGKLTAEDKPAVGHLIHLAQLEKTNASTIVQTVQEALRILWAGAPNTSSRLLLMVTDSVAYMLSAGKTLKQLYPKLIHATCLAHGMHRVAETIREQHPLVNKLISVGKKIFLKAPRRVEIFKRILPNVALPPEPVITRWGTWLSAANYYYKHLENFKKVIEELEEDAACITKAKEILQEERLGSELMFIEINFSSIPSTIEQLQSEKISVPFAVKLVEDFAKSEFPSEKGKLISRKIQAVLERNCGWNDLKNIAKFLSNEGGALPEELTNEDVRVLNMAPTTSAAVERSFSKLKYILSDRRLSMNVDNLKCHLALYYNHNLS